VVQNVFGESQAKDIYCRLGMDETYSLFWRGYNQYAYSFLYLQEVLS